MASDGGEGEPTIDACVGSGLKAAVWKSCLVVCLFNLLKNAWQNNDDERPINLSAKLEEQDLVLQISNRVVHNVEERMANIRHALGEGLPPNHLLLSQQSKFAGTGLRLVRRLADWHRLPSQTAFPMGYRRGSLSFSAEPVGDGEVITQFTFSLHLPCCESGGFAL